MGFCPRALLRVPTQPSNPLSILCVQRGVEGGLFLLTSRQPGKQGCYACVLIFERNGRSSCFSVASVLPLGIGSRQQVGTRMLFLTMKSVRPPSEVDLNGPAHYLCAFWVTTVWPSDSSCRVTFTILLLLPVSHLWDVTCPGTLQMGDDGNRGPRSNRWKEKRKDVGPSEDQLFPSSMSTKHPRVADQSVILSLPSKG